MTAHVVTFVDQSHREYDTQHGRKAAFKVTLDGTIQGEVTTNAETVEKRLNEFRFWQAEGGPVELDVSDGGLWPDGNPKPMKIKKPQDAASPQSSVKSSWYNSEEGVRFTQERTDRRTALMQAVAVGDSTPSIIENFAESFYRWLRSTAGVQVPASSAGSDALGKPVPAGLHPSDPAAPSQDHAPVPHRTEPSEAADSVLASAAASGACDHSLTSPLKPDGSALPDGFLRCLNEACRKVIKEKVSA